jgi:DNA-binding transcriptional ArsR family regulator
MAIKQALVPMETLGVAAECLRVLGHPIRLRIVDMLTHGEHTVTEIAEACDIKHAHACEHLRLMRGHGLLTGERRGSSVYYSIAAPELTGLIGCIRASCRVTGLRASR